MKAVAPADYTQEYAYNVFGARYAIPQSLKDRDIKEPMVVWALPHTKKAHPSTAFREIRMPTKMERLGEASSSAMATEPDDVPTSEEGVRSIRSNAVSSRAPCKYIVVGVVPKCAPSFKHSPTLTTLARNERKRLEVEHRAQLSELELFLHSLPVVPFDAKALRVVIALEGHKDPNKPVEKWQIAYYALHGNPVLEFCQPCMTTLESVFVFPEYTTDPVANRAGVLQLTVGQRREQWPLRMKEAIAKVLGLKTLGQSYNSHAVRYNATEDPFKMPSSFKLELELETYLSGYMASEEPWMATHLMNIIKGAVPEIGDLRTEPTSSIRKFLAMGRGFSRDDAIGTEFEVKVCTETPAMTTLLTLPATLAR